MLDQLSDAPSITLEEYKLEKAVQDYYWLARVKLSKFMEGYAYNALVMKLSEGLKKGKGWAYSFCEEADLTDYEIAGLKEDKAMIADLMYQDKEASY